MIVGVGVGEYRLRLRLLQHFFQIGIEETRRQVVFLFELCDQLPIGLGDSNDLQVGPLLELVEESEGVAMHESGKRDT